MSATKEWSEKYQELMNNPPASGDILKALGGEDARLDLELHEGKPPFIYGRVYVPCVVGHPLGWFLHGASAKSSHGLKCILLPKPRDAVIRAKGILDPIISVKSLKVIRKSTSGSSLLCDIHEL